MKYLKLSAVLFLLTICLSVCAQQTQQVYAVAFYNLENLYHWKNNGKPRDKEFTSTGKYKWTEEKYTKKLNNIAYVINRLGKERTAEGAAIVGIAEVENRQVLQDLINTKELKAKQYKIVHYDSPDRRGIDVALLYNPRLFKVTSSKPYPYRLPGNPDFKTRDQLLVSGTFAGEALHVIVNHWPSRYGVKSSELREVAASITKHIADSLYKDNPACHIIIMGDLNDNADNHSTRLILKAKKQQKDVKPGGLFNTSWKLYEKGIGSARYKGKWDFFDQIIISHSLLGKGSSGLRFLKAEVYKPDFLIQQKGKFKGYPLRSFSGTVFMNGYSDHLPALIYMIKGGN